MILALCGPFDYGGQTVKVFPPFSSLMTSPPEEHKPAWPVQECNVNRSSIILIQAITRLPRCRASEEMVEEDMDKNGRSLRQRIWT